METKLKINTDYLKQRMKELGFGVSDLAYKSGKKESWIYLILAGHGGKSFSTIETLAKVLEVNPKDLIK